jgi:hypothetical protein
MYSEKIPSSDGQEYERFKVLTAVTMKNAVFWDLHGATSQKTEFFKNMKVYKMFHSPN